MALKKYNAFKFSLSGLDLFQVLELKIIEFSQEKGKKWPMEKFV